MDRTRPGLQCPKLLFTHLRRRVILRRSLAGSCMVRCSRAARMAPGTPHATQAGTSCCGGVVKIREYRQRDYKTDVAWQPWSQSAGHAPSPVRRGPSPLTSANEQHAIDQPVREQLRADGSPRSGSISLHTADKAEREGFEPSRRLNTAYAISNRAPSANSDTSPEATDGSLPKSETAATAGSLACVRS